MKTIKLNKKILKNNTKKNKYNKMKGGSTQETKNKSLEPQPKKKSRRLLEKKTIPVLTLGKGNPTSTTYNKQLFDNINGYNIINTFIQKIRPGYQIVCLPMPPNQSHSIVVELIHINKKNIIKISDLNGDQSKNKDNEWINYIIFIELLKQNYGNKNVSYYEIDPEIRDKADERCKKNNGQGGCSEYVHLWLEKQFGNTKALIFENK